MDTGSDRLFGRRLKALTLVGGAALALIASAAHAQASWVVGQSAPLTGGNAAMGRDLRDGAAAYFKLVNARGGVAGKPIELVTLDDANDRKTAGDRKSTRLNSSHIQKSRMPSSA